MGTFRALRRRHFVPGPGAGATADPTRSPLSRPRCAECRRMAVGSPGPDFVSTVVRDEKQEPRAGESVLLDIDIHKNSIV